MTRSAAADLASGILDATAALLKVFDLVREDYEPRAVWAEKFAAGFEGVSKRWGIPSTNGAQVGVGAVGIAGFGVEVGSEIRSHREAKRRGLDDRRAAPETTVTDAEIEQAR